MEKAERLKQEEEKRKLALKQEEERLKRLEEERREQEIQVNYNNIWTVKLNHFSLQ